MTATQRTWSMVKVIFQAYQFALKQILGLFKQRIPHKTNPFVTVCVIKMRKIFKHPFTGKKKDNSSFKAWESPSIYFIYTHLAWPVNPLSIS